MGGIIQDSATLAALIQRERDVLVSQWRERVCRLPVAARLQEPELIDHIPQFLDELVSALRTVRAAETVGDVPRKTPPVHGIRRYASGFDLVEVVAEYSIMHDSVFDLAEHHGLTLDGGTARVLNRVLDHAIGQAVQAYMAEQAADTQRRRAEHFAFVAHDLRTPLQAMSAATSVLEQSLEVSKQEANAQALGVLRRNVRTLESLVERLLDEERSSVKGVEPKREDVSVRPLVDFIVADIRPLASAAGMLLINAVPPELRAWADPAMLRRIFRNLIANAISHAKHGAVTISGATRPDGGVECSIRDAGVGIEADLLGSIFKPQATGGLGLLIVKTFVEAHGGEVHAEANNGAGVTLRFSLPGRPKN